MSETQTTAEAAEKAYAAASEQATAKPVVPAKAKPAAAEPAEPAPAKAAVAKQAPVAKRVVRKAAPKVAPKPAPAAKAKPAPKAVAKPVRKAAVKAAKPVSKSLPTNLVSKLKDSKMATTAKKTTEDFAAKFQDAVKDVQARAKTAFEKGQDTVKDANEFSKGNLEALAESGKILREGVQAMGKSYVAGLKSNLETLQADVKVLRAVKSPKEFIELQGSLVRKYFDTAVAANSKRTEALVKLANEAFQPLSSRVSLAVEKVKKAA